MTVGWPSGSLRHLFVTARGSFICHLASEHGKLIDLMRADDKVEMEEVIQLIARNDDSFKKFVDEGTKTEFDDNVLTIRESLFWK